MAETKITFLGTGAALPGAHHDSTSFLVNDTLLFDCGWYCAVTMQECGSHPFRIETLFFTHLHPDHYGGLPGLLTWRGLAGKGRADIRPLHIVGPPDDLPIVMELCRGFLQVERYPSMWPEVTTQPLAPGETWETERYRIDTIRAKHPPAAVSGRLLDRESGVVIAFSGDSAPNEALVELARDADLLIHEATLPPDTPEDKMRGDHSRSTDAARIAKAAGLKQLRLVHLTDGIEAAAEAAAREIFPESAAAREGEVLILRR